MKAGELKKYLELVDNDAEILIRRFIKGSQIGDYIEECMIRSCQIYGTSNICLWEDKDGGMEVVD